MSANDAYPLSREDGYSYPPTPQDWNKIQNTVRHLYVVEKRPLKDVRQELQLQHGFRATERMIKARLRQWGYLKNAKKGDWGFLAILHQLRKQQGKSATVFEVRGHRKTVKDLQRFVRNQSISFDDFLAEAQTQSRNMQIPRHIRALTPDDRDVNPTPTDESPSDTCVLSPTHTVSSISHGSRGLTFTDGDKLADDTVVTKSLSPVDRSTTRSPDGPPNSTEIQTSPHNDFKVRTTGLELDSALSGSSSNNCTQLQHELEACGSQLFASAPLKSRLGMDEIHSWALINAQPENAEEKYDFEFICSRCNQSSSLHFVSLDNFEPQQPPQRNILNDSNEQTWHLPVSTKDEGSWLWVSRCFLACMCLTRGKEDAAQASLKAASNEFERLLRVRDPMLLTAANLVTTILHMHDQGVLARRVLESAEKVTERLLFRNDPIRITINYLTASANLSLKQSKITSSTLLDVYDSFRTRLPSDHPFVIASHHNLSWMLKFEDRLDEAECHAKQVYERSSQVLGRLHMQSITSLSVIAGCLKPQRDRRNECVDLYRSVIYDSSQVLGASHPYTLEAKRRLAGLLVMTATKSEEVLQLYRDVLWGRARMLGKIHPNSIAAKADYEWTLTVMRKWNHDTTRGGSELSDEQRELQSLFRRTNSPGRNWVEVSSTRRSNDAFGSANDNYRRRPARADIAMVDAHDADFGGDSGRADNEITTISRSASVTSSSIHEHEAY